MCTTSAQASGAGVLGLQAAAVCITSALASGRKLGIQTVECITLAQASGVWELQTAAVGITTAQVSGVEEQQTVAEGITTAQASGVGVHEVRARRFQKATSGCTVQGLGLGSAELVWLALGLA